MSMAEVIESIERDAFRQVTPMSVGNNEKIECSQLEDEPVIIADSKKTADILKSCFTDKAHEMSLVEFAEKIAPFPLSEFQKQLIREYEECEKRNLPLYYIPPRNVGRDFIYRLIEEWERQHHLTDARCSKCNRLLGKFNGQAEIKCPKCGEINRIGVYKDLAEQKGH